MSFGLLIDKYCAVQLIVASKMSRGEINNTQIGHTNHTHTQTDRETDTQTHTLSLSLSIYIYIYIYIYMNTVITSNWLRIQF